MLVFAGCRFLTSNQTTRNPEGQKSRLTGRNNEGLLQPKSFLGVFRFSKTSDSGSKFLVHFMCLEFLLGNFVLTQLFEGKKTSEAHKKSFNHIPFESIYDHLLYIFAYMYHKDLPFM